MKLPDPITVGYPRRDGPDSLGLIYRHNLSNDLLIGSLIGVRGRKFRLNVCYVENNPRREQLIPILEPIDLIDDTFWQGNAQKIRREKPKIPERQEEFPF